MASSFDQAITQSVSYRPGVNSSSRRWLNDMFRFEANDLPLVQQLVKVTNPALTMAESLTKRFEDLV